MADRARQKYLDRRAVTRPLLGCGVRNVDGLQRVVVIPALAESAHLPLTLQSLAANPAEQLAGTLVVVVVNNRRSGDGRDATPVADVEDNLRTLKWLAESADSMPFRLAWVDAASPDNELPGKAGVGLARKIGCDTGLELIAGEGTCDFLFLHLDADTLVEPNYLRVVAETMATAGTPGGAVMFRHQPAGSPSGQRAIDLYEQFLWYYVTGLRHAGSPYAFHTVGSTMACTAAGYVAAGGIPAKRQAGEDFYFLQELAKTGGVCTIDATTVHPSARPSHRVPFGTGPRVREGIAKGEGAYDTYDPRVFDAVRSVLGAVESGADNAAVTILDRIEPDMAREFLVARGFTRVWCGFRSQFRAPEQRIAAFHRWFDGFVTLKLIHHLTDSVWPRVPLSDAVKASAAGTR